MVKGVLTSVYVSVCVYMCDYNSGRLSVKQNLGEAPTPAA